MLKPEVIVFWFRRDLRLDDNAGLYYALRETIPVLPLFIFDPNILDSLEDKDDARVNFIYQSISLLHQELVKLGSGLTVLDRTPLDAFRFLSEKYEIKKVITNHDYEPYAIQRDKEVGDFLLHNGIGFHSYKDQVIFEKEEIIKDNGESYTVFTPYSRRWKAGLTSFFLKSYPNKNYFDNFLKISPVKLPGLEAFGFISVSQKFPVKNFPQEIIKEYDKCRNYPGMNGTTHLGVHLRFGTISVRKLATLARDLNETFLNELIWRDFYQMILWYFPHVGNGKAFKPLYDLIIWNNNEANFDSWCRGQTGYPIVDAGMRELDQTGYMHNRVRMIVASFLAKHLLIDWRWGEAWFARKLLDFDLASNNGGWQWAAGCGCDAAPYFRIFNPYLQTKKFDPELKYIRKWVPEFESLEYPQPIVAHEFARKRCLKAYEIALRRKEN